MREWKWTTSDTQSSLTGSDSDNAGTHEWQQHRGVLQRLPLLTCWDGSMDEIVLFSRGEKEKSLESWGEALKPTVRDTNWFLLLEVEQRLPVIDSWGVKTELRLKREAEQRARTGWKGLFVGHRSLIGLGSGLEVSRRTDQERRGAQSEFQSVSKFN